MRPYQLDFEGRRHSPQLVTSAEHLLSFITQTTSESTSSRVEEIGFLEAEEFLKFPDKPDVLYLLNLNLENDSFVLIIIDKNETASDRAIYFIRGDFGSKIKIFRIIDDRIDPAILNQHESSVKNQRSDRPFSSKFRSEKYWEKRESESIKNEEAISFLIDCIYDRREKMLEEIPSDEHLAILTKFNVYPGFFKFDYVEK